MVEKENPDYEYLYSDLKIRLRVLFKTMDNMRWVLSMNGHGVVIYMDEIVELHLKEE